MADSRQDEALTNLPEERSPLEERLRLLEAASAAPQGEGPLTEKPESVRDQSRRSIA